jgi:hypothetical protein
VVGVNQNKLAALGTDFVVPEAVRFIEPMRRDLSHVN